MKLRSGKIKGKDLFFKKLYAKMHKYLEQLDIILHNNKEFEIDLLKRVIKSKDIHDIEWIRTMINEEYNDTNYNLRDLLSTSGKIFMLATNDPSIYIKYNFEFCDSNNLKELIGEHLESMEH